MTPAENIYRSDEDVVDGLDTRDMMEDDQYDIYDMDDDGQRHGSNMLTCTDMVEYDSVRYLLSRRLGGVMSMPYYFDEFETEDIQDWVRWAGDEIPKAKLRGEDVRLGKILFDVLRNY